jgi:hypothetical protein
MREYLSKSISGNFNKNKLRGLLAEVDLRGHLIALGFGERVSPGGWIARRVGPGEFGHRTAVFFPETIIPARDYSSNRELPQPSRGLHTICATFYQSGIASYFCAATVDKDDAPTSVQWHATEMGLPSEQPYEEFPRNVSENFSGRKKPYKFLRHSCDVSSIPPDAVPEEFSKENLRVAFQSSYFCELSDIDGIFWGQQHTYPLEIKEKTVAPDSKLGPYFGLDIGPFVKLAFYAAKRGNLHSMFVVKEIDDMETRNLINWWFITFDTMAQYASWVFSGGGRNMAGGASAVVKIPRAEFLPLNRETLAAL